MICAFHSRIRPKGTQVRERERERRRGEKEREREKELLLAKVRLLASRRLDSKEQSFARSNERSLIRV